MTEPPTAAFRPAGPAGKWLADLYLLARQRLAALGVTAFMVAIPAPSPSRRFFSHRRDGRHRPHGLAGLACLSSGRPRLAVYCRPFEPL